jgi:hypothetical protein
MARGTTTGGGRVYLDIRGGSVAERVEGPGPNVVERTITKGPNAGKVVYERHDGYVEGVITGMNYNSRTVNGQELVTLQVALDDVGERYILNLQKGYKVWRHFLLMLPNIKPGVPVRFDPYDYLRKKDGKRMTGLGIQQNGEKVEWKYTRENGLPDAPMVKVSGKDMVDYTEQDIFLDMVLEKEKARFGEVPRQTLPPEDMAAVYGGGGKDAPKPTPIGEDDEQDGLPW